MYFTGYVTRDKVTISREPHDLWRRLISRISHKKRYHTWTSLCLWYLPPLFRNKHPSPPPPPQKKPPNLLLKSSACFSLFIQPWLGPVPSVILPLSSIGGVLGATCDCEPLESTAPPWESFLVLLSSEPFLGTLISNKRSTGVRQIGQRLVWNLNTLAHSLHIHCDPAHTSNRKCVSRIQMNLRQGWTMKHCDHGSAF